VEEKPKVAFIGAGKVGTAIAVLLQKKRYEIVGIGDKILESAQKLALRLNCPLATTEGEEAAKLAELIFITTPDSEIKHICEKIGAKGGFKPGNLVIHTSGALSSEVLASAKVYGAQTISLHPLQTFPDADSAIQALPGSYFGLEGDPEAVKRGEEIVRALGGYPLFIPPGAKPLYHAAACVASNYLVTLVDLALELYEKIGISKEEGLKITLPLLKTTLENIERLGVKEALTGPLERGDAETIRSHLQALKASAPELVDFYIICAQHTLEIVKEKGKLSEEEIGNLKQAIGVRP